MAVNTSIARRAEFSCVLREQKRRQIVGLGIINTYCAANSRDELFLHCRPKRAFPIRYTVPMYSLSHGTGIRFAALVFSYIGRCNSIESDFG